MNPKVSVIIPTYNRPQLILKAIKSVLNQTYQNFEIVVVDDSLNDETQKVIENLRNIKIKYTKIEEIKKGSAAARKKNTGVKNASSDSKYIAFLDDDDEYLPNFLEETVKKLEKEDGLAGVIPRGVRRLADGTKLKTVNPSDYRFWRGGVGNGFVLRKEIFFKENIWYDEKDIFEDLDFGIRLKDYRIEIMPQILWISNVLPLAKGTSSSTKFERQADNIKYFFKKHYLTYEKAGKEALGFLYYSTGKIYCQAGRIKEGREHFKKALKINPNLEYFIYYLASLFIPKIFQSYQLQFLKHKLLRR